MAAAAATLSDSARPGMGIRARTVAARADAPFTSSARLVQVIADAIPAAARH